MVNSIIHILLQASYVVRWKVAVEAGMAVGLSHIDSNICRAIIQQPTDCP